MKKKTVSVETFVPAPPAFVFDVFTNHETYRNLPGVLSSTLLTEGEVNPSSGLGAVREIRTIAFTMVEKVVGVQRPDRWDYFFMRWPLPLPHAGGSMLFRKTDGGTVMRWETSFETDVGMPLKMTIPAITVAATATIKSLSLSLKAVVMIRKRRLSDSEVMSSNAVT